LRQLHMRYLVGGGGSCPCKPGKAGKESGRSGKNGRLEELSAIS
jgi:hypothetical protein